MRKFSGGQAGRRRVGGPYAIWLSFPSRSASLAHDPPKAIPGRHAATRRGTEERAGVSHVLTLDEEAETDRAHLEWVEVIDWGGVVDPFTVPARPLTGVRGGTAGTGDYDPARVDGAVFEGGDIFAPRLTTPVAIPFIWGKPS